MEGTIMKLTLLGLALTINMIASAASAEPQATKCPAPPLDTQEAVQKLYHIKRGGVGEIGYDQRRLSRETHPR